MRNLFNGWQSAATYPITNVGGTLLMELPDKGGGVHFTTSTDNGLTWSSPGTNPFSGGSWHCPLANSFSQWSGQVMLVLSGNGSGSNGTVFTTFSSDNGQTWSTPQQLFGGWNSNSPVAVAPYGNVPVMVVPDHNGQPYLATTADSGQTWQVAGDPMFSGWNMSHGCTLGVVGSQLILILPDSDGNVHVSQYQNGAFTQPQPLFGTWQAAFPCALAEVNGVLYMAIPDVAGSLYLSYSTDGVTWSQPSGPIANGWILPCGPSLVATGVTGQSGLLLGLPGEGGTVNLVSFPINWMGGTQGVSSSTLGQLMLPGSHDAGTYALTQTEAPGGNVATLPAWEHTIVNLLGSAAAGYIAGWSKTQSMNFYWQLAGGARFLDLRVCYYNNAFYCDHGYIAESIDAIFDEIAAFMGQVSNELVVIQAGHMDTLTAAGQHVQFLQFVQSKLGQWLVNWGGANSAIANLPVGTTTSGGPAIVFVYDDPFITSDNQATYDYVWGNISQISDPTVGYDSLSALQSWAQGAVKQTVPANQLLEIQWLITPDDSGSDILSGLKPGSPGSLHSFSAGCNGALPGFLSSNPNAPINILLVDYLEESEAPALCIARGALVTA